MDLVRGARHQDWWTQYADLALDLFSGSGMMLRVIGSFTMYFMPALLQTKDYTRDITSGVNHGADPGRVCRNLSSG